MSETCGCGRGFVNARALSSHQGKRSTDQCVSTEPSAPTVSKKVKVLKALSNCPAAGKSPSNPDHVHSCMGNHKTPNHFCPDCRRWWWTV